MQVSGLRGGRFGRWTDGVGAMRADCLAFAEHWRAHNERILAAAGTPRTPSSCGYQAPGPALTTSIVSRWTLSLAQPVDL